MTDASVNQRRGTGHESHTSPSADCGLRLLRLRLCLRPRLRSEPRDCVRPVTNLPSGGGGACPPVALLSSQQRALKRQRYSGRLMRCLVPKVCLGGCKTMVHWSGARASLAALVHDGSDSMGPAEVTGHPGQRQPVVNALSTPRLPCILPRLHPSS